MSLYISPQSALLINGSKRFHGFCSIFQHSFHKNFMEALCDNAWRLPMRVGISSSVVCSLEVIAKISDFHWMKLNSVLNMGTCGFNSNKKIKLL